MLVLSRKKNECLKVNDDIDVVVVEIRGDKVRLGVQIDKDLDIHRTEVWEAIRKNDPNLPLRKTVMLSSRAYAAMQKLALDLPEKSSNLSKLLEQVLIKAAGMDQAATSQSSTE